MHFRRSFTGKHGVQYGGDPICGSHSRHVLYRLPVVLMSGQIDDMLCSGVPVRRALRNTCEECDISGFHTLYTSPEAIRNLRMNLESMTGISTKVNGIKRFILPEVPENMTWTLTVRGDREGCAGSSSPRQHTRDTAKNKGLHARIHMRSVPAGVE